MLVAGALFTARARDCLRTSAESMLDILPVSQLGRTARSDRPRIRG